MQRVHFYHIIAGLITAILTGGCFGTYYVPGHIPAPQFDSTSDLYLTTAYGVGGWQGDVVVIPLDNFWIAGHIAYLPSTDSMEVPTSSLMDQGVGKFGESLGELHGEFGIGWYSGRHGDQISILAGYGRDRSSFIRLKEDDNNKDTIEPPAEVGRGEFEKYFLQVSGISIHNGPNAYARLLMRSEYLRFTRFSLDRKDQPLPTALLIEPRMLFGTSFPEVPEILFEMQIGFQFRVGGREPFVWQPLHVSLALMGLLDLW